MNKKLLFFFFISMFVTPLHLFAQDDFYSINSVQEIRIIFKESNWKLLLDSLYTNIGESGRLKADVVINGKVLKNVGIRYKGFSSYDADNNKNPFNIDLDYSYDDQNYKGYKKLKLSNVISDPSFVREVLSYEILRKYMPASKANYANVYVNDTLQGLYTNVEAVDKIFVKTHYGSKSNSFFKGSPENLVAACNGSNSNLAYKGADINAYKVLYRMESDTGWNDLVHLTYILNNQIENIGNILNVDRVLWMHAFNYVMLNMDSYIGYSQNYYLYKNDFNIFNIIPWDLNMSFGSFRFSDGTCASYSMPYINIANMKKLDPLRLLNYSHRPLFKNLLLPTSARKMYIAHMRTIINENFKNNEYYTRGKFLQSLINTYVQNDVNKFYTYDYFLSNIDTTVGSGDPFHQFPGIKDIVNGRMAYLDTFPGMINFPVITDIQHTPEFPLKGSSVWISAHVSNTDSVILSYRFTQNNSFSKVRMYDDGLHNDGNANDSIYGAEIILSGQTIQYYLWAENDIAGIFSPEKAETEFYTIQPLIQSGEIVINEVMHSWNHDFSETENNQNGWIELFNTTKEIINLKDFRVSCKSESSTDYIFSDTVISPGSYLVLLDKNNFISSGIHSNLFVPKNGGSLKIYNQLQIVIDSLYFTQGISTKTLGRFPNGTGYFTYMSPSFAKYNYSDVVPVRNYDVTVFPNPANENFYIIMENHSNPVSVTISDVNGKIMISEELTFRKDISSAVSKTIDITGWGKGVYVVRIIWNDNLSVKKVVIN